MAKKKAKKVEKKTCGQCKHYQPVGDTERSTQNIGECYRYPPTNDGTGARHTDTSGIVKLDRIACGEFK